jgi:quinol monooxygenase YgiN
VLKSIIVAAALACVVTSSAAQQAAPVVVIVRVFATPGRADELQTVYLKRLEYFRKAEPDATFRLHRSTKDTNSFLWYEVYPSQAAYENHVKVVNENFKKETAPTPSGVLARPSESETFSELGR